MRLRPNRQIAKDLMLAFTCTATQFSHDKFVALRKLSLREEVYKNEDQIIAWKITQHLLLVDREASHDFVSSFY